MILTFANFVRFFKIIQLFFLTIQIYKIVFCSLTLATSDSLLVFNSDLLKSCCLKNFLFNFDFILSKLNFKTKLTKRQD